MKKLITVSFLAFSMFTNFEAEAWEKTSKTKEHSKIDERIDLEKQKHKKSIINYDRLKQEVC